MKMQSVTGHGVGGDAKNIFKDIGRGLLSFLVSTGPGRGFEQAKYGPDNRSYERRRGEVAEQRQNIKGQEEIEQKPIGPMGELACHQGLLGGKEEQNRIR